MIPYIGIVDPLGRPLMQVTKDKTWVSQYIELFKLLYREAVSKKGLQVEGREMAKSDN